ncbi:MAG: hypothetical protein WBH51_01970 [Mycolicibacter algericus]|uniref:hypothetical protein n=1 Tax=Mycolicibacter algericus TaxID=1288388 RepID=UPI003C75B041
MSRAAGKTRRRRRADAKPIDNTALVSLFVQTVAPLPPGFDTAGCTAADLYRAALISGIHTTKEGR